MKLLVNSPPHNYPIIIIIFLQVALALLGLASAVPGPDAYYGELELLFTGNNLGLFYQDTEDTTVLTTMDVDGTARDRLRMRLLPQDQTLMLTLMLMAGVSDFFIHILSN